MYLARRPCLHQDSLLDGGSARYRRRRESTACLDRAGTAQICRCASLCRVLGRGKPELDRVRSTNRLHSKNSRRRTLESGSLWFGPVPGAAEHATIFQCLLVQRVRSGVHLLLLPGANLQAGCALAHLQSPACGWKPSDNGGKAPAVFVQSESCGFLVSATTPGAIWSNCP